MFREPFSFDGRIRRFEFGLSFLIFYTVLIVRERWWPFDPNHIESYIAIAMLIPAQWFQWAQGCKRCHDLGNSGWYQIIPFYFLWLLLADSIPGPNEYGENPKGIGGPPIEEYEEENTNYE
jgi:uncharacterized membrane protein YhaH (DUF805 family)